MTTPELIDEGDGRFRIKGDLNFDTAGPLLDTALREFEPHSSIVVDFSDVEHSDSAGLALLIEWVTWANNSVREIRYEHVPERLTNIAAISEVEDMLVAGERWRGFIAENASDNS